MSLMFEPLRKFATFRGRARRKEYWLFQLFMMMLSLGFAVWLQAVAGPQMDALGPSATLEEILAIPAAQTPLTVLAIVGLLLFLPQLAVSVRRLHDSDKSGWWLLLGLTGVGSLVLLIFYLLDGTAGPNRHGPDPKGRG
jgi:uncharacterized membrane protein YhaH (DUF805 family)